MSIELSDFITLMGDTAVAELAASAKSVTDALRRVEEEHPGYSYSHATEIRCNAFACSQFLTIKVGPGHQNAADEAYAAHKTEHIDQLLGWQPVASEDLGN
ncbi:MAG: hypothetical protein JWO49_1329 [Arthrobacter sp.]|nr:hypothetical protein [Arthrobacter sp.]MCU1547313.1 hypothetical protein [Arthrobacter sp.]